MPLARNRRAALAHLSAPRLVLCIVLGVWLGVVLALLTGWAVWRYGYGAPLLTGNQPAPASVAAPVTALPPPRQAPPVAPSPASAPTFVASPQAEAQAMFDQYQQRLREQALNDGEAAARANPANQGNAPCQFWLEQARTAPSAHAREQVVALCQ